MHFKQGRDRRSSECFFVLLKLQRAPGPSGPLAKQASGSVGHELHC